MSRLVSVWRSTYKTTFISTGVLSFLLFTFLGSILIRKEKYRRHFFSSMASRYSKFILTVLDCHIKLINLPGPKEKYLFVGNHVGFIEILVLSSVCPTLFVTSIEMRNTPGLGMLCEMGGCLFVERRSRANMQNEIGSIRETLKQGFNVGLYPEGTSTNGEKMLPFKKSLMTAAAGTGVPIMPVVVNFTRVNGKPLEWKWRDFLFWYGDHSFVSHFLKLASLESIHVEFEFLKPLICHSEADRRNVAADAQRQIESKFKPLPLGPGENSRFRVPEYLVVK